MRFRLSIAVIGGVLSVLGIVSLVVIDRSSGLLHVSDSFLGMGFSPSTAVVAIVLGAMISGAAVFSDDRGSTGLGGIFLVVAGILGVMARGVTLGADGTVITQATFIVAGSITFVLSIANGRR